MNSRMCETTRDVFARRCCLRPALAPLVLMLLNLALSKCQKSRATTAVLAQVSSLEPQMQAHTCKGRTTLPTCFRKSVCKPGFSFSSAKLRCSALMHGRIVLYRPSRERLAVSTPLSRHQQRRCKANLVSDLRCVQMWPSDTTQWSREMKISFCGFWPRNTFCGIWNIPAADFVYPCSLDAFQPRCFRPRACDRPHFRFWIARSLCFGNINGREIRYVPSREAIAVGTPLKSSQAAACKATPLLRLQCARTWVRDTRKWTYEMKHALCSWWPHNKRCKTWNLRLAKIPLQMPASSISKHGSRSTINTKSTTTVKQLTTTTSTTTTTKAPQATTTATSTEAPLIPGLTFQKLRSMVHSVRHKAMSNMTETTVGPVSARNVQRHTKIDWKTYHRLARMVRQHRKQPTNKGEIEHHLRAQIVARPGSTQPATTTTSPMPSWAAAVHKYSYFDVMSTTAAATTTPPATTTDFNMRVRYIRKQLYQRYVYGILKTRKHTSRKIISSQPPKTLAPTPITTTTNEPTQFENMNAVPVEVTHHTTEQPKLTYRAKPVNLASSYSALQQQMRDMAATHANPSKINANSVDTTHTSTLRLPLSEAALYADVASIDSTSDALPTPNPSPSLRPSSSMPTWLNSFEKSLRDVPPATKHPKLRSRDHQHLDSANMWLKLAEHSAAALKNSGF